MAAYYNEFDPFAAAWLRELIKDGLIADGEVDERSIKDVVGRDLAGFTQCHFFAGIGGWSYALRLAGWDDARPVWTGSCPCQPFSSAARGRNLRTPERDLWPAWLNLIASVSPGTIFGEQVAHDSRWLDRACDALEGLGYEIGAAVLPAYSVGFDHARPRLYFVGHTNRHGEPSLPLNAEACRLQWDRSDAASVGETDGLPGSVALYRGFGNAIIPQLAARFIQAADEAMTLSLQPTT